ncbi:hypothetical protein HMN09_00697900 [Mycena chlorophos]|uniref:MFS general substrate transporter n=1 Tax=Mycena chlorophos TaxID=658473 RepID=A0A8H6W7D2_MYCCL|nr:hypothetical protein HMN09_00697900 [Mycena chlorophos]
MAGGGYSALPSGEDVRPTTGVSKILGPKWARIPALTLGLLAVQLLWAVEMSYAPPYLLALGLAKSNMAIVFAAGPLSGLVVQPLIGILADHSTSRWGRRRPYILVGCLLCALSILLLGFTRDFASLFTTNESATIWLAILSIYLLDFSVNAVMAADRALVVDLLPPSMQNEANAWAARMIGFGGILGFFVGNLNLPTILPFLGSTELQVLSVIVVVLLLGGHLTTATLVREKVLIRAPEQVYISEARPSLREELGRLLSNMFSLPRIIQQICIIQLFGSLGWFPILFYTTMYISDLYTRSHTTVGNASEIAEEGTRLGSRALFFSAILSLLTNLLLPLFVRSSTQGTKLRDNTTTTTERSWLRVPERMKVPLATLWAWSHLIFGACMLGTFFVSTVDQAIYLIALTGVPWAIAQWAPFTLLGEAILVDSPAPEHSESEYEAIKLEEALAVASRTPPPSPMTPRGQQHQQQHKTQLQPSLSSQAGMILGIHNLYLVIPQFFVTILCAVVFAIFEGGSSPAAARAVERADISNVERPNSVVYVFRLGALWAFIAFRLTRRLARELSR